MSLKKLHRNLVPRSLVDEAFSFKNKRSRYEIRYNDSLVDEADKRSEYEIGLLALFFMT